MRFNSVAYDKVFPRVAPATKPESMVTNFKSNDTPNEQTVPEVEDVETNNDNASVEGGECDGDGYVCEHDAE